MEQVIEKRARLKPNVREQTIMARMIIPGTKRKWRIDVIARRVRNGGYAFCYS